MTGTANTRHDSLPHPIGSGPFRPQEETRLINGIHPTKNRILVTYHVYIIRIHHSPLGILLQFRLHPIAHVRVGGKGAAFQAMA